MPIVTRAAGWPMLLHSPSHYGAATVIGPQTARLRWQRRLEGPIVPGPVVSGGVAYLATDAGVLHALRVSTERDLWRFDGGGAYGSDLSTAPLVRHDGVVLWPGPRHELCALGPDGRLRWTLPEAAEVLDSDSGRRLVRDQVRGLLWTAAAVDRRGDAYFASRTGHVFGFDARGPPAV